MERRSRYVRGNVHFLISYSKRSRHNSSGRRNCVSADDNFWMSRKRKTKPRNNLFPKTGLFRSPLHIFTDRRITEQSGALSEYKVWWNYWQYSIPSCISRPSGYAFRPSDLGISERLCDQKAKGVANPNFICLHATAWCRFHKNGEIKISSYGSRIIRRGAVCTIWTFSDGQICSWEERFRPVHFVGV